MAIRRLSVAGGTRTAASPRTLAVQARTVPLRASSADRRMDCSLSTTPSTTTTLHFPQTPFPAQPASTNCSPRRATASRVSPSRASTTFPEGWNVTRTARDAAGSAAAAARASCSAGLP